MSLYELAFILKTLCWPDLFPATYWWFSCPHTSIILSYSASKWSVVIQFQYWYWGWQKEDLYKSLVQYVFIHLYIHTNAMCCALESWVMLCGNWREYQRPCDGDEPLQTGWKPVGLRCKAGWRNEQQQSSRDFFHRCDFYKWSHTSYKKFHNSQQCVAGVQQKQPHRCSRFYQLPSLSDTPLLSHLAYQYLRSLPLHSEGHINTPTIN